MTARSKTLRAAALLLVASACSLPCGVVAATGSSLTAQIQRTLDDYLAQRLDEMTTLVSQKTGERVERAKDKGPAFGLDLVQAYRAELGGLFWYYQGETLGYRCIFAYWPQYNLVMTVATNCQPPVGTDQLGDFVLGKVLRTLTDASIIAPTPATGPH